MSKGAARNYTELTLKKLFSRSGNQCAFPDCPVTFLEAEGEQNLSNICHIEAAKDGGERYNPDMTDKERADYKNLILLCPNHHIETNNVSKYKKEVLLEMKRKHEEKVTRAMTLEGKVNKYPSSISKLINHISTLGNLDDIEEEGVTNAFNTEDKIAHNQVISYKPIIEEFKVYQGKLNKLFAEFELDGSMKKELFLNHIRKLYLKAKGELVAGSNDMESIRKNADALIDRVGDDLRKEVQSSTNLESEIPFDVIDFTIDVIVVDAFMRCKILEEPKPQDK